MRLIDVDYLLKELEDWQADLDDAISGRQLGVTDAMVIAYQIPIVDAVPVRHGRWIPEAYDDMFCYCSECGTHEYKETIEVLHYDYCPYCGAKMDEESDNETG